VLFSPQCWIAKGYTYNRAGIEFPPRFGLMRHDDGSASGLGRSNCRPAWLQFTIRTKGLGATSLRYASLIFLFAAFLYLTGCERSPYHAFCDRFDDEAYDQCIEDPLYRLELARQWALLIAAGQLALVDDYPDDLFEVPSMLVAEAERLDSPYQVPNRIGVSDGTGRAIEGKLYVVRASISAPVLGESNGRMMVGASGTIAFARVDALSPEQREYLGAVCSVDREPCRGDVYMRMTSAPGEPWLSPSVAAISLEPVTFEDLFRRRMESQTDWLERLEVE
jgi:hypothetical protein